MGDIQLQIWSSALRLDPDFGEEAWRKLNVSNIVSKWTGHPSAGAAFGAPKPDPALPGLRFDNQRTLEKQLIGLQASTGAMAAAATRVMCLFEGIA